MVWYHVHTTVHMGWCDVFSRITLCGIFPNAMVINHMCLLSSYMPIISMSIELAMCKAYMYMYVQVYGIVALTDLLIILNTLSLTYFYTQLCSQYSLGFSPIGTNTFSNFNFLCSKYNKVLHVVPVSSYDEIKC